MIRRAQQSDLPDMLEMGRKFHKHAQILEIPFDAESFAKTIEHGLSSPNQAYFVAETNGHLTGMTAGIVYQSYFNHQALSGQEMFWWSEGHHGSALYRALEQWAREIGCRTFTMVALADDRFERMRRLYARQGYRPAETSFIKGF